MKATHSFRCSAWVCITTFLLSATRLSIAQDLVINGDFEQTTGAFVPDGNGAMSLSPGATSIPGWTTTAGEMAWVSTNNPFGLTTAYGSYFLDLTGYHDSPPYGGVRQVLNTTPGERYRLSFALGADQANPAYRGPISVSVVLGSDTNVFTFNPPNSGGPWSAARSAALARPHQSAGEARRAPDPARAALRTLRATTLARWSKPLSS